MIYYVYNKTTGEFAGSGVHPINDSKYSSTTTPPSATLKVKLEPVATKIYFDSGAWSDIQPSPIVIKLKQETGVKKSLLSKLKFGIPKLFKRKGK